MVILIFKRRSIRNLIFNLNFESGGKVRRRKRERCNFGGNGNLPKGEEKLLEKNDPTLSAAKRIYTRRKNIVKNAKKKKMLFRRAFCRINCSSLSK